MENKHAVAEGINSEQYKTLKIKELTDEEKNTLRDELDETLASLENIKIFLKNEDIRLTDEEKNTLRDELDNAMSHINIIQDIKKKDILQQQLHRAKSHIERIKSIIRCDYDTKEYTDSTKLLWPRHQAMNASIVKSKLEKEMELKKQLEEKIKEQEREKRFLEEELKKASTKEEEKKKLEEELEEINKKQKEAEEKLKQREARERELEEKIKQLTNQYKDKLEQTKKAVETLRQPAKEMQEAKDGAQKRITFFNFWARVSIMGSVVGFGLYILAYLSIIFFSNKIDTSGYFVMIFPVIFPIIMALALYRQANIKTKEIIEIDKRLILIHEITQALEAIVEINQNNPSLIDEKTGAILNRLVDNILTWSKPKEAEKESDSLLPKEVLEAIETLKKFGKSEK